MSQSGPQVLTPPAGLYTPEQRARRDATAWTWVQGVLAPLQFLVCLISAGLVVRCLLTGEGESLALWSVMVKTALLYLIMVTGCIWEKVVFGQYLFAPAFFWEDVFSMLVLALHTLYLVAWLQNSLEVRALLFLALAAYAAYAINAMQFLLKLKAARRQSTAPVEAASPSGLLQSGDGA
ncbi:MAG: 2-vinyl bacteriochlorophyllide hydratase [Burkholderiaceae bacterium]